ncbi:unnamed protein product [Ambrosiozyma monospora]|uniref:Unnamed protein product n=1 Tax=Ambrosiozyma monospora TaxID=43982 RepID=A0A9W6YZQ1_AMBMO|nr:unnamed protein product [Ambrosiozyma monospora]
MQAITTPSLLNSGKLRLEKARAREARKALDPSHDFVVFLSFKDEQNNSLSCEEEGIGYDVPYSFQLDTGVEESCVLQSAGVKSAFTTFIEDCGFDSLTASSYTRVETPYSIASTENSDSLYSSPNFEALQALSSNSCGVIADPVSGDNPKEKELQNISSPVGSFDNKFFCIPPAIPACLSSTDAHLPLVDKTSKSNYYYNVEPNPTTVQKSIGHSNVWTPDTPVVTENKSHKRKQLWSRISRWWHRKTAKFGAVDVKVKADDNQAVENARPADVDVENNVNQYITPVYRDLESLNEYTSVLAVDTVQYIDSSSSSICSLPLPPHHYPAQEFEQVNDADSISCLSPLSSQYSAESDVEAIDTFKEHNLDGCDWLMMQVGKKCDAEKFKMRLLQTWNSMAQD